MLLRTLCSSSLAAVLPSVCVPGLHQLLRAPAIRARQFHAYPAPIDPSPISVLLDPLYGSTHSVTAEQQQSQVSKELLRYSTHFPEALYGHLAGLVASRPFPTAVDMSCAQLGPAGNELGRRGFRVAESCPPAAGCARAARLPGGCTDVVTVLPGPTDLHSPDLLAEARRLMATGGYLAVAWNDRDLTSPFVSDLESLVEQLNPHYCRSSRQHSPPAVLAALSDGGSLALHSYTSWGHSMSMAKAAVLQDLLGGFAVVRPYLAASSTHRKAFHQAVRALVRHHFGDDEAPFELPLTTKLFVMKHSGAAAATASASTAAEAAAGLRSISTSSDGGGSSSSSGGCAAAVSSTDSSSSSSSEGVDGCGCGPDDGCMTHHVRTQRAGLSSRDSCTLRHLYA